MFGALLARLGLEAAAPVVKTFARPLAYLAAGLAILLAVLLVIRWDERRFAALNEARDHQQRLAIAARDLHWTAEIEKGNRLVAERHAADLAAATRDAEALRQTNGELFAAFTEMEKRNAQKPGGATPCLDGGDLDELRRLWKHAR